MFAIFQGKPILNNLHGYPGLRHLGPGPIAKLLILYVYYVLWRRNPEVFFDCAILQSANNRTGVKNLIERNGYSY
jgi:hypothetical protein